MKKCAECGLESEYGIERHHVFQGTANRKISEKYGMVENLCHEHHTGDNGIHFNKEMAIRYKQKHQGIFEAKYGHELFMVLIKKNYL